MTIRKRVSDFSPGLCFALLLVVAAGCRQRPTSPPLATSTPPAATLHVGLTSSATVLADLVTQPYAQHTGRAMVQFIVANTTTLFADLNGGQLDAILVHTIPAEEPHWFNPVALDGLALVVHPDNPVQNLSRSQAQAIFSGRIANWAAVGGPDQPIVVVGREGDAGARALLNERIMAGQPTAVTTLIQPGHQATLAFVANEPAAIGYAMMASAAGVKLLTVDGLAATPASTAAQTYPLTVPLYFAAPVEPGGELRAFLAWLQSDEGQAILGEKFGRVR